ncbi:MAG: Bug family tripartite tricarboxylate transporter substrate binding protein [Aquabacterium sp.]
MLNRRLLVNGLLAAYAADLRAQDDLAPAFTRPLRLLVPAGPGSVPDVRARWLAERLAPLVKQPVLVENRPGAGGIPAMEQAARAEPDGHTLVMTHVGLLVFNPLVYDRLGYDPLRDFRSITRVGVGPLLLLVAPESALISLADLVADAKARPGAQNFASPGIGTPPHLAGELLLHLARVRAAHIPYTSPTQPIADLMAGRVQWLFEGTPVALPLVVSGRLRALAVTGPQRLRGLSAVPTVGEAGLPDLQVTGWNALAAPAATPQATIDRLYRDIRAVLASPEAEKWFGSVGNQPGGDSPETLALLVRSETQRWAPVIQAAGVRLQR